MLVYRRVVKYVAKHYICTCASVLVKYVPKYYICTCASVQERSKICSLRIIYAHVLVYRRVVKYVAKHYYICTCTSVQESS